MTFIVRCPKCRQTMKCSPRKKLPKDAVKKCVYCGRSFKIHINLRNSRIVKQVKK